jgi:Tol biopolymer transport system component
MKINILFLFFSFLLLGCNKNPDPSVESETFNYNNLTGKIAFSRSNGRIVILDGNRKTSTFLTTKDKESVWDGSVSLSPDGESITYSACANDGYQIYRMDAEGGNYLKLTKSLSGFAEHYTCPVWSADGENIFYVANGLIILGPVYSIRPDGTDLRQITDFDVYRRVSISKDKSFMVYACPPDYVNALQGINLYTFQDDSARQIKTYDISFTAYNPVLSPDEKKIAFIARHGPNESGTSPYFFRLMSINVDGTDEKLIKELPFINYATDTYVTWSPDGNKLAFNFGGEMISDFGSHIFIINADGTGLTQVTSYTDFDGAPSWIN